MSVSGIEFGEEKMPEETAALLYSVQCSIEIGILNFTVTCTSD